MTRCEIYSRRLETVESAQERVDVAIRRLFAARVEVPKLGREKNVASVATFCRIATSPATLCLY
jgi:hypothetical protein